jgi:hypothetical protein
MVSRLKGIFRRRQPHSGCREVHKLSSDYIDEELDQPTTENLKAHLNRCGPCNSFINTLKATVSLLRSTPRREAPGDFKERIRQRMREENRR